MIVKPSSRQIRSVVYAALFLALTLMCFPVAAAIPNSTTTTKKAAAKRKAAAALAAQSKKSQPTVVLKPMPKAQPRQAADSLSWAKYAGSWSKTVLVSDSTTGIVYSQTLALALEHDYLVVPWSFVAEVSLARTGTHFFVDDTVIPGRPSSRIEAHLVDLDVGADVALLRTDRPLANSALRGRLRIDTPQPEEALLVLATHDSLRSGGRFLGFKNDGPVVRYQLSLGNTDLDSAKIVFDREGRLVAIAPHPVAGESTSWAAPGRAIYEILRRQDGPRPAAVNPNQFRRQLFTWQEHWTRQLILSPTAVSLRGLDCKPRMMSVTEPGPAATVRSDRSLACESHFTLPLGGGYTSGLSLWTGEISLSTAFDGSDSAIIPIEKAFSSDIFSELDHQSSIVNLLSVPECDSSTVVNHRGEKMRIRFCTSAVKRESGFNDSIFSVASMQPGPRTKYVVARLKGFSQDNSRKILESLVDNIRSLP